MEDRELRLRLARAIWRTENEDTLPEGREAIAATFQQHKSDMMAKAARVMRYLGRQKIELVADDGAPHQA